MPRSQPDDDFLFPESDERGRRSEGRETAARDEPSIAGPLWLALCRTIVWDEKVSRLAAALTYRTIFSLVPVAIVCMVIVRGVVGLDEAKEWMRHAVYDSHAWKQVFSKQIDADSGHDSFAAGVDHVLAQTWGLRLTDVGIVGGLLMIWSALGLFQELEAAFNETMRVREGRSFVRRLTMYWAFVTAGPLLVFGSLYGASMSASWMGVHAVLPFLADFAAAWLMLLVLYKLLPNTEVQWSAALVGSFASAVMWVAAKWGFEMYVVTTMPYSALYGSLALVPLFLFWLYMMWWIVLLGLQIAAFRQGR